MSDIKIVFRQAPTIKVVFQPPAGGESGASYFTELADTPSSLDGQKGKTLFAKAAEDGLEFGLPNTFPVKATENIPIGKAFKVVDWNSGENVREIALADQSAGDVAIGVAAESMTTGGVYRYGGVGLGAVEGTAQDPLDTSSFPRNTILYVNGSGNLSDTDPNFPSQPIALVLRSHSSSGALQISAQYPKQVAGDVEFTPTGNIAATRVQAAIEEMDTEKQAALGFTPENIANKGQANGYASLGGDGLVPVSQLPVTNLEYQGVWDASSNTPTLASGAGTKNQYYRVSVDGSTNLDGETDWKAGDWAVFNGSAWDKVDNTETVSSVVGLIGAITKGALLTALNVADGATANSPDVYLLSRDNHTGQQILSTLAQSGATDGQVVTWNNTTGEWEAQDASGGGETVNFETITAHKTLQWGVDDPVQYLEHEATFYNVTLSHTGAVAGATFTIKCNTNMYFYRMLDIYDNTTQIDKLYTQNIRKYIFNGTNWEMRSPEYNIAIGRNASGQGRGAAIGYNAQGGNYGVALGYSSNGANNGASLGSYAVSNQFSPALGYNGATNYKFYSVALGAYAQIKRTSEMWRTNYANYTNRGGYGWMAYFKETSNNTPIEAFAMDRSNERFIVQANSVVRFRAEVTARDNTSGEVGVWELNGVIKRDGSNNTSLVGTVTKTEIHKDDAGWDVNLTADDTNEALKVEVTGDASNTVRWNVKLTYSEVRF